MYVTASNIVLKLTMKEQNAVSDTLKKDKFEPNIEGVAFLRK